MNYHLLGTRNKLDKTSQITSSMEKFLLNISTSFG